jgi:hypothetical protein
MITLAVLSPLTTFSLSPLSFFDMQPDGLRLSAGLLERIPEEESDIVRLVRTPEGRGLGIMRANSGGEAWRVVENGSRLVRSDRWKSADHVVVLDAGRVFSYIFFLVACSLLMCMKDEHLQRTLP